MWRSRATSILLRSSFVARLPSQMQVRLKVLAPSVVLSPNSSRLYSLDDVFIKQYRFFSTDSSDADVNRASEEVTSVDLDKPSSLGETSDPSSVEPVLWVAGFGEDVEESEVFGVDVAVSQESESCSLTFQEGQDNDDISSENPGPLYDESKAGVNIPVENFASEESVEVTSEGVLDIDIEMLENLLSFLQSTVEEPLESALDKMGLTLNTEFVTKVLETPVILGDRLVRFFKWAMKQPEYVVTSNELALLVRAVSDSSDCSKDEAYMLWDFVKQIGETEKELLTTSILNMLLSLFCKLEKARAGFEVFSRYEDFGCIPNADSYYLTIQALSKRSMIDKIWSVCEKMLTFGELPDGNKIGKIVAILCKGKRMKDAYYIYLTATENNKSPPHPYVNFLVSGLSRNDDTVHMALELLENYPDELRKYAIKPFTFVIIGLCRIKDAEKAKKLLYEMVDSGPPPGNTVFNYVISSLSKAGEMEDAISLMKLMENRGLRPDLYTYNVIMSGFAKGGLMDEARKIFEEAKKIHPKLISDTYHILIRGHCKIEEFNSALECLREMRNDGLQPHANEYNKFIASLCLKALDWRTAEMLLKEMNESGWHLKGITHSLIAAVKELEEEELKNAVVIEA